MKTLPVAVQVYSVRDDAEKDFAERCRKLRRWFEAWNWQAFGGLEPAEIKAAIADAGLCCPFPPMSRSRNWWPIWTEPSRNMWEIGVQYIAIPLSDGGGQAWNAQI